MLFKESRCNSESEDLFQTPSGCLVKRRDFAIWWPLYLAPVVLEVNWYYGDLVFINPHIQNGSDLSSGMGWDGWKSPRARPPSTHARTHRVWRMAREISDTEIPWIQNFKVMISMLGERWVSDTPYCIWDSDIEFQIWASTSRNILFSPRSERLDWSNNFSIHQSASVI